MRSQCKDCPYMPKKIESGACRRVRSEREKCKMYELCEAPFCPLDPNSLSIWYAGEEICRDRGHRNLPLVQAQFKLVKVAPTGYFTLEMLKRNCIIKTGILGLDPDKEEKHQLQLWLKNHPEKQEITEEEREKRRELMKKNFDDKK